MKLKRILSLVLALFTLLLVSCEVSSIEELTTTEDVTTKEAETTTEEATTKEAETTNPTANMTALSSYKIIYSEDAKSYEYDCALALQEKIIELYSITIPLAKDTETEGKTRYEIVVGNTNRSALYELDTSALKYGGYLIKTEGKRFIVYGKDKTGLNGAVSYFASILTKYESELYIEKDVDYMLQSSSSKLNYENVKAMWLSQYDMHNIYYDETAGAQRDVAEFRTLLQTMLDNVVSIGINTIVVQTRPNGDSMYPSEYYAPCDWVVGEYGNDFTYDPIAIVVEEAHARDLSIHAWINPMRCMTEAELLQTDDKYQLTKWIKDESVKNLYLPQIDGKVYLNPAYKEVRDLIVNGARELLTNYNFDGLHMDDYFYPTSQMTFDSTAYNNSGKTMSVANWRRDNVNKLVHELYVMVKEVNEDIKFGISPQGNMDNNYNSLYADMYTWCANEGYIDYICPQIYWGFEHTICPFAETAQKWNNIIKVDSVEYWVGMSLGNAVNGSKGYSTTEWNTQRDVLKRCLEYTLQVEKCVGVCYFCYQYFWDPVEGTENTATKSERMNFVPVLQTIEWQ